MESTLAAIDKSKNAAEVFSAVNGFLGKIRKTNRIFQTLPGAISIRSVRDIKTWLQGLRRMANAAGAATPSGETLAEMYAVLRAALRKLESI